MNLFATSLDPAECAGFLDDARVVNQCRETAQLVSTALADAGLPHPYKPTHTRHPVTRWVLDDHRNFLWTLDHLTALAHEHKRRFPTSNWHASYLLHAYVIKACQDIPREPPECLQNSARNESLGLDFTHLPVTQAYRAYLAERWRMASREPRFGSRGAPWWLFGDGLTTLSPEASEATTELRIEP